MLILQGSAASGSRLAGHDDWRLPTHDELCALYDLIEAKLAGDCMIKVKGLSFWSGESEDWGQVGFWQVYPFCGGVDFKFLKQKGGVVRAGRP